MDDLDLLALATEEFRRRLAAVDADQHFLPTPCDDWNVNGLVSHVLGGNHMAVRLLEGAHRPEAIGYLAGLPLGEEPLVTYDEAGAAQLAAFASPGALDRVCEHPMGDVPGAMVLGFRVGDLTLHTWDLAVATDGDTELHPELLERVWTSLQPIRDSVALSGVFGEGPSGEVGDDAPLQQRLLDLVGRRP
jgi:uncharacterized protein (TIGR03086 family)